MSCKTMIASLASAIVLGFAAFSAQAAPVVTNQGGVRNGEACLVQQVHYRYYRYHRHRHHYWRWHHRRHWH